MVSIFERNESLFAYVTPTSKPFLCGEVHPLQPQVPVCPTNLKGSISQDFIKCHKMFVLNLKFATLKQPYWLIGNIQNVCFRTIKDFQGSHSKKKKKRKEKGNLVVTTWQFLYIPCGRM